VIASGKGGAAMRAWLVAVALLGIVTAAHAEAIDWSALV
jgi:hypothetical protein